MISLIENKKEFGLKNKASFPLFKCLISRPIDGVTAKRKQKPIANKNKK